MGLYTETVIATRTDDSDNDTADKGWEIYGQLVVLLYCFIGFWTSVAVIAYLTWSYIGLIIGVAVIGLGFWACRWLGTNNSLFDRSYYRPLTPNERIRIRRRLKGE